MNKGNLFRILYSQFQVNVATTIASTWVVTHAFFVCYSVIPVSTVKGPLHCLHEQIGSSKKAAVPSTPACPKWPKWDAVPCATLIWMSHSAYVVKNKGTEVRPSLIRLYIDMMPAIIKVKAYESLLSSPSLSWLGRSDPHWSNIDSLSKA